MDTTTQTATATDPTPLAPIKPGYQTSEFWTKVLVTLLGLLVASGVIPTTGQWAQLGVILGMFGGSAAYTVGRSSVKRAQTAANSNVAMMSVARNSNRAAAAIAPSALPGFVAGGLVHVLAISAMIVMLALSPIIFSSGCGSTTATTIGKDIKTGGSSFLSCEAADLTKMVGSDTLLGTVARDLLASNYGGAIDDLITKLGSDAVGCAMFAIATVTAATVASAGSGSGSSSPAAAAAAPLALRAQEMIKVHGWQLPPAGAATPATAKAASK